MFLDKGVHKELTQTFFLVNDFYLNPPEVTNYNTDGDGKYEHYYDLGITNLICYDEDEDSPVEAPRYFLDQWCVYNYSWFAWYWLFTFSPVRMVIIFQAVKNMHCIDTFKCMRSYCLSGNMFVTILVIVHTAKMRVFVTMYLALV